MTKTEKLTAAWSVLQSKNEISEMLTEIDAKPDEISAAVSRLESTANDFENKKRNAVIAKYADQLALAGIGSDELLAYMSKSANKRKGGKRERIVIAVVDGVEITNFGAMPAQIKEKGIKHRNDIPAKFWTEKGKAYFESKA